MNLFRFSIIALSLTLMFSIGSSSSAATDYSHPEFSVTDDRILNLRETGSKIVLETIEDSIRQGGVGLLGEGFQIDSSLNWVFGETIEGEVDAVVPLWSKDGHIIFTQPGLIVWPGIEEENRIDGNLGAVYRTDLANIIGINAIGGASVFYDYDFQVGHSRISFGVDAQHKEFHAGLNYYQPLSDEEGGREGYIEDAIRGMDARLTFQRNIMRVSANLGYWRYEGDGTGEGSWELSYGMDAGIRVLNGIFIEGGYEKHDDASIDDRLNLGVAFKFSLPDLKGQSYGDGSMSSNLYRVVEREKRILYEEWKDGPTVSFTLDEDVVVVEGGTVNVGIRLNEALEEGATLHLIGSGTATYNDDYTVSVDGGTTNCSAVTGTSCQITGDNNIEININNDGRGEDAETIILSVLIVSGDTNLTVRGSLTLRIPEDPPFPTVFLMADSTSIAEGESATLTVALSEVVNEDVVINLQNYIVAEGEDANYGTSMDYHLNNGSDCNIAVGAACQVTIRMGQRSATATINVNTDMDFESTPEPFTISIDIASAGSTGVMVGNPSMLNFTIPADPPPPTVTISTSDTSIMEGLQRVITFTLSEMVSEPVTLNLIADTSSTATYGGTDDWVLNDGSGACTSATGTSCQITIPANSTTATTRILVIDNMAGEGEETAVVRVMVDSGSRYLVQEGDPSRLTFNIAAD